jgi:hypothetical protein
MTIPIMAIYKKGMMMEKPRKHKRHKKDFYNLALNVILNKRSSIKSQDMVLVNITVY